MNVPLAIILSVLFIVSFSAFILSAGSFGDNDIDRDARDARRNKP